MNLGYARGEGITVGKVHHECSSVDKPFEDGPERSHRDALNGADQTHGVAEMDVRVYHSKRLAGRASVVAGHTTLGVDGQPFVGFNEPDAISDRHWPFPSVLAFRS